VYTVWQIEFTAENLEQMGTKEKFWFRGMVDAPEKKWLFKFARVGTGEHWAEKIAEQLCESLGIPHVVYELALCNQKHGVITPTAVPKGHRMVMGNEVLHHRTHEYPTPKPRQEQYVRVREHTVTRVLGCLDMSETRPPEKISFKNIQLTASDIFCGYLMLDTLISNQDRHHENWAIIINNYNGEETLCPTYDHGASLGRELRDAEREERLTTRDKNRTIYTFVRKAKSELFKLKTDRKRLLNIDCFYTAVEKKPIAKEYWLSRLEKLEPEMIDEIINQIPEQLMSSIAREFTKRLIMENRTRLIEDERY
jgi:hypothetical protein